MKYGKSFPSTMERIFSELATYGFTFHTVKGDGTIRGHSINEVFIDEAPNVGTTGWTVQNRLNWATLLLCHHCNLKRDIFFRRHNEPVDSYIQNA
ncbi:hypothetical protein [Rheinheimera sp. MMS21-TC3]|uniref:hypothetical protein n=1 Tax=Rheinheimera sp. MMS21-TC3 TaxID=3072790 RepID=UPI0028C3D2E2|nr:hypothetical protein [Rheinheimera sp. MMS21-TC3]WNO60430.1 hypothetical protein RDV63_05550 [Rheinheimera sp. MMS21-TC3]